MSHPFSLAGSVTLTQLGYVVAVDTHRHFGKAAESCHVTQPTLSMQLRKLERALGVVLFDRSRTPVVPTDAGRVVAAQARVALREAARVADIVDAGRGVVAGELRIGVIPTLAPYLLPRVVDDLARVHPHLELVVEERVTDDVLAALRRDTLDAGLIASATGESGMVERSLFREPFVGYVGAGHRLAGRRQITGDDLSLDDLWLLTEGHCFRSQVVRLCSERSRRHHLHVGEPAAAASCAATRFESGNLETLKRLVERGRGMTLLPALAAAELPTAAQRALIVPFAGSVPARDVRLVRRRAYLKKHLVDAFVRAVLDAVPASMLASGRADDHITTTARSARPANGPARRR